MSGIVKVNSVQLGDSGTAANNFVLSVPATPDGTVKLSRGNVGATTQDVLVVDSTGNAQLKKTTAQSMVRLNTSNGYGSTNTKIRRFTNVATNQGTDITYADSATLGASFTINTDGVYAISYTDMFTSAGWIGLSINTVNATVSVESIPVSEGLSASVTGTANWASCVSWIGYISQGSIIRPHTSGGADSAGTQEHFTITRVS